jgi:hypothetical protein
LCCEGAQAQVRCAAQKSSSVGFGRFPGLYEGIFGTGKFRRLTTQQKLTLDTIKFSIEPMLAGLVRPDDQFSQNFQPSLDLPGLCIRHGDLHRPKWFTKVAVIFVEQCPALAHIRETLHPIARAPLCQAV